MAQVSDKDAHQDSESSEEETNLASSVIKVREILERQYSYNPPPECNGFLERCLRMKDYSVENAAKLINGHHKSTLNLYDMIKAFDSVACRDIYFDGIMTVLKSRDGHGRKVIVLRVGKWNPKQFDFDQFASAGMLLFNFVNGFSPKTSRKGIIFIHDMTNFGLQHVKAMKISRLTALISAMQDGAPGRIKETHIIFHPRIFGVVYQCIKPFLKEKMAKRMQLHGDDLSSLHNNVNPDILPISLGGKLEDDKAVDDHLLKKLLEDGTTHKEILTYGLPTK